METTNLDHSLELEKRGFDAETDFYCWRRNAFDKVHVTRQKDFDEKKFAKDFVKVYEFSVLFSLLPDKISYKVTKKGDFYTITYKDIKVDSNNEGGFKDWFFIDVFTKFILELHNRGLIKFKNYVKF